MLKAWRPGLPQVESRAFIHSVSAIYFESCLVFPGFSFEKKLEIIIHLFFRYLLNFNQGFVFCFIIVFTFRFTCVFLKVFQTIKFLIFQWEILRFFRWNFPGVFDGNFLVNNLKLSLCIHQIFQSQIQHLVPPSLNLILVVSASGKLSIETMVKTFDILA